MVTWVLPEGVTGIVDHSEAPCSRYLTRGKSFVNEKFSVKWKYTLNVPLTLDCKEKIEQSGNTVQERETSLINKTYMDNTISDSIILYFRYSH